MTRTGRLAFVPARYGPGVVGGAELVLADLAHGLAKRGWDVEILTTCAVDHFTWVNELPPGVTTDGNLTVRRFPAVVDTPRAERAAIHARILAGETPGLTEQQRWMNDDVRVPELWHWLLDHGRQYRAVVFAPYLFWPAFACSQLVTDRAILMPCLHDEPEMRLEVFRPMFEGVHAMWFLSEPEAELARATWRIPARHELIGAGVPAPAPSDVDEFRARHGLTARPYVLYAGRREGAKGWETLLASFAEAVQTAGIDLDLATCGANPVTVPPGLEGRVHDLGYLSDADRDAAVAGAAAYVQPSALESFSRTIMEAWLAGTPVIANGASAVVRWHIERSGAGLLYETPAELAECLRFVAEEPDAAARLAAPGAAYVRAHYDPDDVLDRVEKTLDAWTEPPAPPPERPRAPHPERILVVTPYAPHRDGIAAYAVQEVAALRGEGHDVEVLSPGPSAAHHHLDLRDRRGPLALAKRARRYDRVILQFHPDVFYRWPSDARTFATTTAGLLAVSAAARRLEVRLHEFDDEPRRYGRANELLSRLWWRRVDRITVHTPAERDRFCRAYGLDPVRVTVVPHGGAFARRTSVDQATARASLGVGADVRHVFVTLGFVQPHKGFDRAVRAFADAGLGDAGCELHIVGSVRVDEPAFVAYAEELAALVASTPGVTLHQGFVSDETFDRWIVAADTIVLPYRLIWSSGVMERAALYGRPVIATRVGGLADQAPEGTVLVDDDAGLLAAMRAAAGISAPPAPRPPWPVAGGRDAIQAAIIERARRASRGR